MSRKKRLKCYFCGAVKPRSRMSVEHYIKEDVSTPIFSKCRNWRSCTENFKIQINHLWNQLDKYDCEDSY